MSVLENRSGEVEPTPGRPRMEGYGVPQSAEGLLPWSHAQERLERARNYWIGTVRPDGRPHAAPVWGVWVDDTLYFGSSPRSQKVRNLTVNPAVAVHLENGDDVVMVEGSASAVSNLDAALFARIGDAYAAKYDGYRPESTDGLYAVRPAVAMAWDSFPTNVTCWLFGSTATA